MKYYRHNIVTFNVTVTFCISVLSWSNVRRCIGFKSGLHTLCETKNVVETFTAAKLFCFQVGY